MSSKRKLPSFLLSQPGGARHRSQPAISSATSSSAIDLTLDYPPREHQLAHPPAALLTSSQSSPPSPTSLSPPSPLAPPSPPPPFRLFDLPSELLLPIVSHLSFWELFHCRAVCRAFAPLLSGDSSAFALYTALSLQPSAFCDPIRTSPYSEDHASQEEWVMAYDDRHVARIRRLLSTWTFPSVRALYLGRAASDVSLIPQRCRLVERLHYSVSESLSERVSTTFLAAFPAVHAVEMKGVNVMTHLQCLLEHEQLTAVSLEQEQGAELSRGHRHTQEQLRLVYETMGGRRGRWPALRSLKLEGLKWRWITSQLAAPESLTSLSIVRAEDDPLPLPLSSWLWKHPSLTQLTLSCVPARASSTSLTANLFDDYAQHQDQLEATRAAAAAAAPASRSRRKVTSAMPLSDPVVALSPVVAYRTYTALLSLDVSGNEWVTERGLRQIGAVYPSLTSLNLGDNRQLGKQALLVALSLQHFPSLTSLHANRLRKTAFAAVNTPSALSTPTSDCSTSPAVTRSPSTPRRSTRPTWTRSAPTSPRSPRSTSPTATTSPQPRCTTCSPLSLS